MGSGRHGQTRHYRQVAGALRNEPGESVRATEDCRELVAQGLIRHVREKLYEVTNDGQAAYEALTAPEPPERSPVGFRPDSG